jgi:FkbM family methyltransferase
MSLFLKGYLKRHVKAALTGMGLSIVPLDEAARYAARSNLLSLLSRCRAANGELRDFIEFSLVHFEETYSQWQQDLFALWANRSRKAGYFVEFGAADGITLSNTYLLEKQYAWSGLLIEPHPNFFSNLRRLRPRATCIHAAIDPSFSESPHPLKIVVADQLSSLEGYEDRDLHTPLRQRRTVINVPSVNLNKLLAEYAREKPIDFMSIDTEGSELDILRGMDFDSFGPNCLVVEVNNRAEDCSAIEALMERRGYQSLFDRRVTRGDLWFRRRNIV